MVNIIIDGIKLSVDEKLTILEAAHFAGANLIDIL